MMVNGLRPTVFKDRIVKQKEQKWPNQTMERYPASLN